MHYVDDIFLAWFYILWCWEITQGGDKELGILLIISYAVYFLQNLQIAFYTK